MHHIPETTLIIVIIPAYNEEKSIGKVLSEIPDSVAEIIVVDNNSSDRTAVVAKAAGATVLKEDQQGYGHACLKAMDYLSKQKIPPDVVVFLDGDYSDEPKELTKIVAPIIENKVDFVVGARKKELREKGAMTFAQIFGNGLATALMRILFKSKFTDLGPFRTIRYDKLLALQMEDKTYGWTVEMQLKVLKRKYTYIEVPVHYKKRIGVSKVSGTLKGTVMAGLKILGWIFKYSFKK